MRVRSSPAELLLRLPHQLEPQAQTALFRQALTALAQETEALGPPPLDGIEPGAVESVASFVLERGLTEQLDFIAPGSAAVALYELSSACGSGSVKRELRRKVFSLMFSGNAHCFVPVASRMALGAAGPLSTPTLRARVALCLDLPHGSDLNVSPLALALVTRSHTHPEWVAEPAMGALPRRRLAAKLLEHAAREAVSRFQLGDPQPRNLLLAPEFNVAFRRLLADREPLVWRHAAVARGLLAAIHGPTRHEVEQALAPDRTITHWRRAAVSLVASTLMGDEEAERSVQAVLDSSLCEQDRGLAATMVLGVGVLLDAEPERAERLLARLGKLQRPDVAFAVSDLMAHGRDGLIDRKLLAPMAANLKSHARTQTAADRSLVARAVRRLEGHEHDDLSGMVHQALLAFESLDAPTAYSAALRAVNEAHDIASFIEGNDPTDQKTLGASVGALVDLDSGAFAEPTLVNLLLLARRPGEPEATVEQFERLQNRTSRWILDGIEQAGHSEWSRESAVADQRRLRVLLHLVDADGSGQAERTGPLVARLQRSIRVLLQRLADGPDAMVHRILCAALARSFDAAVREGVTQASDLVLVVAMALTEHHSVETIAEACTSPDVAEPLRALSKFVSPDLLEATGEDPDTTTGILHDPALVGDEEVAEKLRFVARVMSLSQGLVGGGGYHAEALRRVFFRLGRALELVAVARAQAELVEPRESATPVLEDLTLACEELARMVRCAELRVAGMISDRPSVEFEPAGLRGVVERGLSTAEPPSAEVIAQAAEQLAAGLPAPLAEAVEQVAFRIHTLPQHAEAASSTSTRLGERRAPLPNWLLPRRIIGPFYVIRPLGSGGVSSVFLARRIEDRNKREAEAFAVKVPEYDPATARSMTEADFFQMFRDEAGALLSLPAHPNLARFVTFDLSARPKPILVMELIQGTPLDRLIDSRSLTMRRVMAYLDGILAGLEAMHGVGVGHLDIKASNVILRNGGNPVLVDFGLSGRTLRPGCGTVEYTSPEVLGVLPDDGFVPTPPAADMYSFGCLAFEMLTRQQLFQASDELEMVTKHVSHDGWLPELAQMDALPGLARLSRLLASCLRHDPRNRPTAAELRETLTRALLPLTDHAWPLTLEVQAEAG